MVPAASGPSWRPDVDGVVDASAEEAPDLAGEHAAAGVVLQGELSLRDTERRGGVLVEDLLDLLELDEVVARPDRAEAQPGKWNASEGSSLAKPVRAAVPLEVQSAALLDPLQRARVDP